MAASTPLRNFRPILILLAALLIVVIAWLSGRVASGPRPPVAGQEVQDTPVRAPQDLPPSNPRPPHVPKAPNVKDLTRSEESWRLDSTGAGQLFHLALDQAMTRDPDGKETLVPLDPPATMETLPARLGQIAAGGTVFPVAYLDGEPRSVASRRVVTEELRVRIDAAKAAQTAAQYGLKLVSTPDYAPGWAILAAAGPLSALEAMERLRADGYQTADILLAAQRSERALPDDPLIADQWHLKNSSTARTHVNVESAWNYGGTGGVKGTGIRVGVVDDGLQTAHPDLSVNVDTANDNDWNGGDSDPNPGTGDDHGTSCAGNVGGRGNNSIGVSGTAPEATLVGLRLIAASVSDAQEAEAMSWRNDLIQVKSNSWGPSDTGTVLEAPGPLTSAAFQTAVTSGRGGRGTIILWAAGNGGDVSDNSNYDGYANAIQTIAIGATDSVGNRAYYSEPGANVVVCAPSSGASPALGITTVDRTGSNGYNTASSANGGDYANDFGGTSSATPTAAGIVALMLEKNANLGWRDVQEILIRSAYKFKPTDTGWATNGAGIPFNHNFGAGLIDATSAVNMASTWTNLSTQSSVTSTQSSLAVSIPNNQATGITRSFDFSASNLRVEQVTVQLDIDHTARGNLEITLTAPSGMVSRLAEVRSDSGDDYPNWKFSSVRHWGELSKGTWTVTIADRSSTGNSTGGTLRSAEIKIFGTSATPVNPAPVVRIDSPLSGAVFSPGSAVAVSVSATDLDVNGAAGTVAQVQLSLDGNIVATDSSVPYLFSLSPSTSAHTLVALATDSEGAAASSASVSFTVVNQIPVITTAVLNATGQAYANSPLQVASVTASDPEGITPTLTYQWQASTDGITFVDEPGATGAILAALSVTGKLWRCVVTASDGSQSSTPFTTDAVNVLVPLPGGTLTGQSFSYSGGLVLRGAGTTVSRRAILHEFSQGTGTAEWIEILTMEDGSLAYWDLRDAAGNTLVFLDDPIWDNIPAGTLIVIYNGASKDSLLPADDTDPSDGRMVLSSTNAAYFDDTYDPWLPLGNSGDSIFLADEASNIVHRLAYGNSSAATPNVGTVGSGKAAYFSADTDEAANVAANWTVTSSSVARSLRALLPGVTLNSGAYSQNFNTTPGASGTSYPSGWTAYNNATEDTAMIVGTKDSTAGANYNYGSRIGLLGSSGSFDTSSLVLAIQNTTGVSNLQISYDVIKIREQPRSHDFVLQYSLTSPTTGFVAVPSASYTSSSITAGTVTPFPSILLPAAVANQASTVYLRWLYSPSTSPGTGARDGLALDNVVISGSGGSGQPSLTLNVSPTTFSESAGASAATATVSVSTPPVSSLVVALGSDDTSEVTLPANVSISAGASSSASFAVTAVDDALTDGTQSVILSATASGYTAGTATISVTDNEVSLTGVTPGSANSPANALFVTALRTGALAQPALFRLGSGSTLPAGLILDPATGLLSGTITTAAGSYPITIERYNSLGEIVSQSFTLVVSSTQFSGWIAGFSVGTATGRSGDFDGDGLPNAVENILGTRPDVSNSGLAVISATPISLTFRHTLSNTPAADLAAHYEWSRDLVNWYSSGIADSGGTVVSFVSNLIQDQAAPANDLVEATATVIAGSSQWIFVRLAVQ